MHRTHEIMHVSQRILHRTHRIMHRATIMTPCTHTRLHSKPTFLHIANTFLPLSRDIFHVQHRLLHGGHKILHRDRKSIRLAPIRMNDALKAMHVAATRWHGGHKQIPDLGVGCSISAALVAVSHPILCGRPVFVSQGDELLRRELLMGAGAEGRLRRRAAGRSPSGSHATMAMVQRTARSIDANDYSAQF